MRCPLCQNSHYVEIKLHFEGLACGTVKECGNCGAVWSKTDREISMISVPKQSYVADAPAWPCAS